MPVPVTTLSKVGSRIAQKLAQLGIESVEDLLFHLPLRYEDRTQLIPICRLKVGDSALIEGVIQTREIKASTKRRSLICMLTDGKGTILIRFFHFTTAQYQQLQAGTTLRCFGEVRQGYHCLELIHPEYKCLHGESNAIQAHLTPVYPNSSQLPQNLWRRLIAQSLQQHSLDDFLPATLLTHLGFPTLTEALTLIHQPPSTIDKTQLETRTHPAFQRLAFEELLAHHLSLRFLNQLIHQRSAPCLRNAEQLITQLLHQLPFQLTVAQQKAYTEIANDLRMTHPMQRLLQGDVGAGKTIVAALSALQAIESGYQVAVMAPTEMLAEQHFDTFRQWFQPLNLSLTWLIGSLSRKKREQVLSDLAQGRIALIVGTHALFQSQVTFAKLGLIIVDEQHRFGVHQRLALWTKGKTGHHYPHQLIMTATPIPRTLAMTTYADLDISVIDELPPGRIPVHTVVMPNTRRHEVIARIRAVCQQGRQAYWVCPLIESSDALQLQAAEETVKQLRQVLSELSIGLVHGRMPAKEKEKRMIDFKAGNLSLLVATTVIEVGVDVPNASLMIIENAERLGLAQLHQLRGRVGRSILQSYCVLLYQPPLSEIAQSRLTTIRNTNDGFAIAQHDLKLRGPGEVLGTRQTGALNFRVADLQRDQSLLNAVVETGKTMRQDYPERSRLLIKRWLKEGWQYGEV